MEFENYFVTVERIIQPSCAKLDAPKASLSFKIPRFKPPSYSAPLQKQPPDQRETDSKNHHTRLTQIIAWSCIATSDVDPACYHCYLKKFILWIAQNIEFHSLTHTVFWTSLQAERILTPSLLCSFPLSDIPHNPTDEGMIMKRNKGGKTDSTCILLGWCNV